MTRQPWSASKWAKAGSLTEVQLATKSIKFDPDQIFLQEVLAGITQSIIRTAKLGCQFKDVYTPCVIVPTDSVPKCLLSILRCFTTHCFVTSTGGLFRPPVFCHLGRGLGDPFVARGRRWL
jgi:hypothetical protein